MRKAQIEMNLSVSLEMNILRLYRWINRHYARQRGAGIMAGDRRGDMAHRANVRRYAQDRQFKVNAFRNPMRRGRWR